MASVNSADYNDIKTAGSGFSFTGNLAKLAINDDWVDGYNALINSTSQPNSFTSMWNAVSSGAEDVGNTFYKTIRNYIDDIGNIDTCGIDALKNYANITGLKSDYLELNISFPIEIKNLVEIFSVNPAYLYNKTTDGSKDTLVLTNSILHYSTVEKFLSALKDKDEYEELVNNVFYNTIVEFLNLKTTTFDDSVNGNEQVEIWKTDPNRFMNRLWSEDITSDEEMYALKESLGVSKSFTEKIYADDIISGKRKMSDFSDIEQSILKAEIKSRETRYGDSNAMRYYYIRLFKVIEYFRFATIVYNNAYELEEYELNDNKYNIIANSDNRLSLLKFNYSEYEIDTTAVKKVAKWLSQLSLGIRNVREQMKSQCKRNMMVGTKRLIVDIIRKFILEKIDGDVLGDVRNSILYSAGLNKKFGVSIIEYSDMTEYFNIENPNDAVKPSEQGLHGRYWEMYDDCGSSFSNDDVLSFYNRLFGDSKKFIYNTANDKQTGSDNLYEFLSILFESGATATTNSDYYLSSDLYVANGGTSLSSYGSYSLSDEDKSKVAKYTGDMQFGDTPYANHKNMFHPSYQMHPFVQAFEEYNEAYTSVMNLVNSYTENINESFRRLDDRLDSLGNTINFWYNWNDDFSGYSTTYEKSGSDFDIKTAQEGPFNFKALQEFITHPGEYINNILNGVNEYYYDTSTGKSLLTLDEIRVEVARLQKYSALISKLSKREIYKYGKDYNGNIYILYKNEGNRNQRNALGDVWVRLRNHPIAFPLFDLSLSPVRFNETSCINESDNSKLLAVLVKIMAFFKSSYGLHNSDITVKDGSVDMSGITLSIDEYTETVPITTRGYGYPSSFEFKYDGTKNTIDGKFRLVDIDNAIISNFIFSDRMEEMDVYEPSSMSELSGVYETYYFVDSTNGDKIPGGDASTFTITSSDGNVESNPTGCVIMQTDDKFFNARYDAKDSTFEINPNITHSNDRVVFADYEDVNSFDGKFYYCLNTITGKTHPCTKRTIRINRLFAMSYDALSGTVMSNGNVVFGGENPAYDVTVGDGSTPFSRYVVSTTATSSISSTLDGGMVYEDFTKFKYYVVRGGHTYAVDSSEIVVLGGSNPYHITRDSDGNIDLEKVYTYGSVDYSDVIEFSDTNYRTNVQEPSTLSSFAFSSCEFVTAYKDGYSDTIGQFYLRGRPYTLYQPFTELSGHPFRDSLSLSTNSPTGSITLYSDDGNVTFYYNLASRLEDNYERHIAIKQVGYDLHTASIALTSCKLNGSIGLIPEDSVEYPIYLDFTTSNCDNTAVYSSYMSEISQQKFFDMGFSYNQKLFYLSYTDGSDEYLNGGTIVGTLDENFDENYNSILSFHRDGKHNVEYVDSRSSFLSGGGDDTFHIGDVSSKRGIFSIYGKYNENDKTLEISVTLFSTTNVATQKFGVDVRNGLYEFDSGSKYSFAVSCTDTRLYVSFTIKPPSDDDVISNTVNGSTEGAVGSTKFGNVSSSFMDCMVQIVSFDITDDELIYEPDETRFILGGGEVGFFQQFSGMLGKNNIFSNSKLSTDSEFPIQPQFSELSGSSDIEFLHTYESEISGYGSNRTIRTFDRYVNIIPYEKTDSDSISGFLVEIDHKHAMLSVASSGDSVSSSIEFESIGGRPIIDLTRGLDGYGYDGIVGSYSDLPKHPSDGERYMVLSKSDDSHGESSPNNVFEFSSELSSWKFVESKPNHGVNVISDGLNKYNRCAAFIDGTDAKNAISVGDKRLALIPIHSENSGYTRFDFDELIDVDNGFYSFHSDGHTVSVLSVSSDDGRFNPMSGIYEYAFYPYDIVDNFDSLPDSTVNGRMYTVKYCNGEYPDNTTFKYDSKYSEWVACEPSEIRKSDIVTVNLQNPFVSKSGYSDSSTIGGIGCFGVFNENIATWFGAYGEGVTVQIEPRKLSDMYKPIPFSVMGVPSILNPILVSNGDDFTDAYLTYGGLAVAKNGESYSLKDMKDFYNVPSYSLTFRNDETIVGLVNTAVPTVKLINTSLGYVYRYDVAKGEKTLSHTFDSIKDELDIENLDDFKTVISETEDHIMVSYWTDERNMSGVLRTRKNTPDSIAEPVAFIDSSGRTVSIDKITKFLSIGKTVLAEENGGYRIFISKDDGSTFIPMEMSGDSMHLIGCGTSRFYARYGNGEKVYSDDGETWINAKNIHASNWTVINASGIDYIACDRFDDDVANGLLETDKFVIVKKQLKLKSEYRHDKMRVDSDGNIVCISGMDGSSELSIARTFIDNGEYSDFEYITYPYVKNMQFGSACVVGDSLLLSPYGGMTSVLIMGAFNRYSKTSIQFIDISSALNNEINVFGGFGYANGRLMMYPSDGNAILIYDSTNMKFHRLYSFDSVMTLCDCDSIDFTNSSDAILSPRSSSINGRIKFSRTLFDDRNDYGIIEVDEGFPILVTYSKMDTYFDSSDVHGDVYKIVFTFLNDVNRKSVSILTNPNGVDLVGGLSKFENTKNVEGVYIVNGRSIRYAFRSIDSSSKFVIEKKFSDYSTSSSNSDGLEIYLSMQGDEERSSASIEYSLEYGTGRFCVYGDIAEGNPNYSEVLN